MPRRTRFIRPEPSRGSGRVDRRVRIRPAGPSGLIPEERSESATKRADSRYGRWLVSPAERTKRPGNRRRKGSKNRLIRSGVGVSGGKGFFAVSETPVSFFSFARFFSDYPGRADALYLAGALSRFYCTSSGKPDRADVLAGIIGCAKPVVSRP